MDFFSEMTLFEERGMARSNKGELEIATEHIYSTQDRILITFAVECGDIRGH